MCGIVGVASPTPMTMPMKEFFQDLLFHDVIRGPHATGVAAIDTMDRSFTVEKKALPAQLFLLEKEPMENLFAFKHNFNIYIGHNRYATSGAKDADANAHPFIHDDIVGVHNGSLRNQRLLDDHEKFVVDSDNLYYHLANNGVDDTITKANGAYALCWYDKSDNSLNFLRNDERPLAIGKLSNGSWVWASEMGMLQWLVRRHKQLSWATYKENGIDYNCVYQLEPMQHMKFEFTNRSRMIPTPRLTKKTAPVFPSHHSYQWPDDYDSLDSTGRGWRNNQRTNTHTTTVNHSSTDYAKKIAKVLEIFLAGGAGVGSMIEVEYLGKYEESSRTGYVAKMELFKYQSINGKVAVFHQYQHDGSFTRDWTEKDIGTKLYGAIANVVEHNNATYACIKNEDLGHTLGITGLTRQRPNRFWPYCDAPKASDSAIVLEGLGLTQEQARIARIALEKPKEGEDAANVLPFRVSNPQQTGAKEAQSTGSQESKGQLTLLSENATPDDFMARKIHLANGFMTQREYIEVCTLNAARCAECAKALSNIPTTKIWYFSHFDRDSGKNHDYLHCSRRCMIANKEECELIDQDYDKRYGGTDDV